MADKNVNLRHFVDSYAPQLTSAISDDVLKTFEVILTPIFVKSFTKQPLPPLPIQPLLVASIDDILDGLGFGVKNDAKLKELLLYSPQTLKQTLSIVTGGYTQFLIGLSLDLDVGLIQKLAAGSAMLLSAPPIPVPPIPLHITPTSLTTISKFPQELSAAILAWACAHLDDSDLRLGGIKPQVNKF